MAWGRNASCLWLLAALLALHISASAQSETPCGYNIQGDDCVKKDSAGSWGLNEGKKSSGAGSRTSAPLNSIAFVGIFVFAVFAMRALFVFRLRQQRLLLQGAGGTPTGASAGSDFMCLHSNGCKQILKDDLVKLTTAGDEGTLWVMLSKSKTNPNDLCEAVVEITPVHWKRVEEGTEEPCPHEEDRPSKFGLSRDSSVSLTPSNGSQAEHEAQNQNSDGANRTVDASGRSSATGVGKELQPLGDACCICLERCSDVRFGTCKHAAVCRECWLTTLHTWRQNTAPTCPMCRMHVPSFSVFDAARGVCDEESQQGGGIDDQRRRSVLASSQDEERGGGAPQPYSLARLPTTSASAVAATPGTRSGGGGLTAWFTRPPASQNLTPRQEMRPFEAQPGAIMYPFDSSQENAAASPSTGPMRPIESPSVRPLASGATLGNAPIEDVSMSLTASIVFPSAEASSGAVSNPYSISMAPGVRSNV